MFRLLLSPFGNGVLPWSDLSEPRNPARAQNLRPPLRTSRTVAVRSTPRLPCIQAQPLRSRHTVARACLRACMEQNALSCMQAWACITSCPPDAEPPNASHGSAAASWLPSACATHYQGRFRWIRPDGYPTMMIGSWPLLSLANMGQGTPLFKRGMAQPQWPTRCASCIISMRSCSCRTFISGLARHAVGSLGQSTISRRTWPAS